MINTTAGVFTTFTVKITSAEVLACLDGGVIGSLIRFILRYQNIAQGCAHLMKGDGEVRWGVVVAVLLFVMH